MSDFTWLHPERHDLYLAARIFAGGERDGDWIQWATNTVLIHIELYDDPLQGRNAWLFDDELAPANAFGEALWAAVEADPYRAPALLASSSVAEAVQLAAATLVATIERNGRGISNSLAIDLARAAAAERPSGGVQGWWANVLPFLNK